MTAVMQSPVGVIDLPREERIDARPTGTSTDFERLYAEFMPRVRGLIRKLVFDDHLGDDLVQETFLRAYNAGMQLEYHQAHPEHTQWPWLAAVARNLCLDVLRKNGTEPEHVLEDEAVAIEALGDDPELHLLATRRRESIAEALCSVTERQRRILVMKCVEGKRYDEIAAAEGISVEALKSVLARARRTFRTSYAAIAERRGLGILVGGGFVRGISARLRSFRDRMVTSANGTAASFMAGGPAAVNAAVTAAVLGGVAVVGTVFAPSVGANEEPVAVSRPAGFLSPPPASSSSAANQEPVPEAVADSTVPPAFVVPPPPDPDPEVAVEPVPAPSPETGGPTASVDTGDVLPAEDPPAGGQLGGSVQQGPSGSTAGDFDHSLDLDGDGDGDLGGETDFGIDYCANPENGPVSSAVCHSYDEALSSL